MRNELCMSLSDIITYLQDENGIKVNRDLCRRQITYNGNKINPREKECHALCVNLMSSQRHNPLHKTFFSVNSDSSMKYAAWALGDWLQDYERHGIVPGISMDCKSNATRFGFSLFTINGKPMKDI